MTNEAVESGTALYRIRRLGTDFPRLRDYRVGAVAEEGGLVRSMRVAYEARGGLGIEIWFAYDAVGGTTVTRLVWLDHADEPTGGRTVVPANASG